ncbi:MAG: hypothetical protein LBC85_01575 [Fibromonadaceae bacterium]|jgi:hypothetical protein|nr:hypothetical protein [Fibromonadaceae bacterium]
MLKNAKKTSKVQKKTGDRNHSWAEAVKHNSLFYGEKVIITKICQEEICPTCGNGELIKPLKWKVAVKKGSKWTVVEEHPLNCNVETAFGKYGLPMEFVEACGYHEEKEAIKP